MYVFMHVCHANKPDSNVYCGVEVGRLLKSVSVIGLFDYF